MTPLIGHCLGTSVDLVRPLFLDIEVVSAFSLLNSTAVNPCDQVLVVPYCFPTCIVSKFHLKEIFFFVQKYERFSAIIEAIQRTGRSFVG